MAARKKYAVGDIREPVIMRVRMRRMLLNRIHRIVEWDRERTHGAWNLSDGVRECLTHWVERREREIALVASAGPFTGESPYAGEAGEDPLGIRPG
jgi:hypothetical protein